MTKLFRIGKKSSAILIAVSMLAQLSSFNLTNTVQAATTDKQIYIDAGTGMGSGGKGATVGNRTYNCQNLAIELVGAGIKSNPNTPGFSRIGEMENDNREAYIDSENNGEYGGGAAILADNRTIEYQITLADNPILKRVAQSGQAEMRFKGSAGGDDGGWGAWHWSADGHIYIYRNGNQIVHEYEDGWGEPAIFDTGWFPVNEQDVFTIKIVGESNDDDKVVQGVKEFAILFQDTTGPTLNNYTFKTNGIEHTNDVSGKKELLIAQYNVNDDDTLSDEKGYMDINFNFSEPIQTEYNNKQWYPRLSDEGTLLYNLVNHVLFTNPCNTGYFRMGEQALLKLAGVADYSGAWNYNSDSDTLIRSLGKTFNYKYTAERGDFTSNKPIFNEGDWIGDITSNNTKTLLKKMEEAKFYDAAGNSLNLSGSETADNSGNTSLNGKNKNPFSFFDVIVDAEPPTYSKTMNGIYPDILTKLILNQNDIIDFQVNFSESVVPKRYYKDRSKTNWDPTKTYLHLNNGQKAYYISGDGTKTWEFITAVPLDMNGATVETPLLKTLALANDAHTVTQNWQFTDEVAPNLGDTFVITDYVGNPLTERANVASESIQSSIDWAQLAVDNTKPIIGFDYPSTGASNKKWGKMGSLSFNAVDDPLPIPQLDPEYYVLKQRPSLGIFRPSNSTAEDGNVQTGLVYYIWSKNAQEPVLITQNQFAAVKKYSLTGSQPEGYQGTDQKAESLLVANNFSDSIIPPNEAYTSENSGIWYLHAFTSDMTWDSARQRIQYNKLKALKETDEGKAMYQGWMDKYETDDGHDHTSERPLSVEAVAYADGLLLTYSQYQDWIEEYEDNEKHICPTPDNQPCAAALDYALNKARKTEEYKSKALEFETQNPQYRLPVPNCNEAVNYANYAGMKYAGDYDKWTEADYMSVDSNWTYTKTEILLDNKISTIEIGAASGNNMPVVEVSVSATDENSGLKEFEYQFVSKGESVREEAWTDFEFNKEVQATQIATATTFGNVITDGEYVLYVKTIDACNNENIVRGSEAITVNSESTVVRQFSVASNADGLALKSLDVAFSIGGLTNHIQSIKYAATDFVTAPATGYQDLTNQEVGTPINTTQTVKYQIPKIENLNGTKYLHIEVIEGTGNGITSPRKYHFYTAYKLDNTAPTAMFNPNGMPYPRESVEVQIQAVDDNNGVAQKYMLIKSGETVPTIDIVDGWTAISGNITIDGKKLLDEGKEADYTVCVYLIDEAGNKTVVQSPVFKLFRKAQDPGIPENTKSQLLAITGDAQNGFFGTVKLDLGVDMKEGYQYSVCAVRNVNGTVTVIEPWSRWLPYTNFVNAKLPISNLNDRTNLEIWVKFKSPGGTISTEKQYNKVIAAGTISQGALYATAERDILKKLPIGKNITLEISAPVGVKVTPSAVNPQGLSGSGKTYYASKNACYAFDIADMTDSSRKDILYVVVDNFDDIIPQASVTYSIATPTNSDVTAMLDTSEAVRVTNNGGEKAYTFKQNGSFTFEFEDEVGNKGEFTASVDYIDKSSPEAKIVETYSYSEGTKTKEYKTIEDVSGNVVLAQGVVLTPQKLNANTKDFKVISNDKVIRLTKNGNGEFTIIDSKGNTAVVSEKINYIISDIEAPNITYEFVDENGASVAPVIIDGEKYARANLKVILSGKVDSYEKGNRIYNGNAILEGEKDVPVIDGEGNVTYQKVAVSNEIISDNEGNYSFSKIYKANGDATIAICDKLGNVRKIPLKIRGIDKALPEIVLNNPFVAVTQNKENFDWRKDLGGYVASDDRSKVENITVELEHTVDLAKVGKQEIIYIAKDQAGNETKITQNVYVMPSNGMLVIGNNSLVSAISSNKALFKTNKVHFNISRYDIMKVGGADMLNEWATYDLYYVRGLFREGQMKYIASKQTLEELTSKDFTVTFDKAGWYTIIVRNAEREREFTTFFISAVEQ